MTQEEDSILIEQIVKNNDQKASNKLYNWYYKEVKIYLKKKYKLSPDDVDDLSSDAISKSFINLKTFDRAKSTFKTWLYTIAENVVLDHKKKLANRVDIIHYEYLEDADERKFEVDSGEDSYSAKQAINYATESLDTLTKDLIKKKYIEGYSHKQIGEQLSLTSNTVSNKINYAKSKITKTLKRTHI